MNRDQPAFEAVKGKLINLRIEWQAALIDTSGREIWSAGFRREAFHGVPFGGWVELDPSILLLPPMVEHTASISLDGESIVEASRFWAASFAEEVLGSLVKSMGIARGATLSP